jgi:hypothetical protein
METTAALIQNFSSRNLTARWYSAKSSSKDRYMMFALQGCD